MRDPRELTGDHGIHREVTEFKRASSGGTITGLPENPEVRELRSAL
jgi:hypothetical protein